ncbi:MAG: TIGR04222 domain-containing membrane protein [Planctomycetota bacterium]
MLLPSTVIFPFNLSGTTFLGFFLGLIIVVAAKSGLLRWLIFRGQEEHAFLSRMGWGYMAVLRGCDGGLASMTAVILAGRKLLSVKGGRMMVSGPEPSGCSHDDEIGAAAVQVMEGRLRELEDGDTMSNVRLALRSTESRAAQELENAGLLVSQQSIAKYRFVQISMWAAVLLLGAIRLVEGAIAHHPISILLLLMIAAAAMAFFSSRRSPGEPL